MILTSQTVSDPGTQCWVAKEWFARLKHADRERVVIVDGVHRPNHAPVIGHFCHLRQWRAEVHAAVTVARNLKLCWKDESNRAIPVLNYGPMSVERCARMAKDKDNGVVNDSLEVFGYNGLYVIDGSSVPANLGVNPSLTITAISEYAMSKFPNKNL